MSLRPDTRKADEITFGVEIECTMPINTCPIVGGYHRGASLIEYNLPRGWNAQSDASIRASAGYCGVEIVSPILRGLDGIEQIEQVTDWLNSRGAKVNSSCGLHIHVGWSLDKLSALRRLISYVASNEDALYAATGSLRRMNSHYARPIKDAWRNANKNFRVGRNRHGKTRVLSDDTLNERFHGLNVTNLLNGSKNTVEFRCFAGTTNTRKIALYVQTCLGLVQLAEDVTRDCPWDYTGKTRPITRLFAFLEWSTTKATARRLGWLGGRNSMDDCKKKGFEMQKKFLQKKEEARAI